jgi:hypothetical protein
MHLRGSEVADAMARAPKGVAQIPFERMTGVVRSDPYDR